MTRGDGSGARRQRRRRLSILPALLAAAACAGEAPPPAPRSAPSAAAAPRPAAEASGPVTRFDGRYAGTFALLPDRTRRCPEAPAAERELTVRNGRASLMFNPQVQQTLTGTVGADGSVRMADSLDRTIATSGVLSETGFRGEHRNGLCSYSVQMTKRG
jgi:hypothetical protein